MILLEYLLVLTAVICCTAAPASEPEAESCGVPPRFEDKELQGDWNEEFYKPGTVAQYSCRPGFSRLGAIQYACVQGQWSVIKSGQCKKKSCGHPGDIDFGTFELKIGEGFVFGAIVEYTCNDGYQMISRHRTRECTATGWSNYRPECEVRYCPPVQVNSNVNPLSYEEEYSVGQVIRFECKNANQKLKGASEVFCTSDGEWNAPPPTCEEISCSPPDIDHGSVNNPKPLYKDKETLQYSCNAGYKPSTFSQITCSKDNWRPVPICEEIVCYKQPVRNGRIVNTKEIYKEEETVILTCDEGYQIEHKPEEPRKCTAQGWRPAMTCISKKCDKPTLLNGRIDSYYGFPMTPGYYKYFDAICNSGFLTASKTGYDRIYCTKNGWEREPKCFRRCNVPSKDSINAYIIHTSHSYIEGEKLTIQCFKDHTTLDGKQTSEINCLADGKFSGEQCYRTCKRPELVNGTNKTNKNVFEVGADFIYECNEGFVSSNDRVEGRSQCIGNEWQPEPECKEIKCALNFKNGALTSKSGQVIHFTCPRTYKLEGPDSSQCFYYGWGPPIPTCKAQGKRDSLPDLGSSLNESKCPPAFAPPNAQVKNPKDEYFNEDEIEIVCDPRYLLYGSEKVLCKDGKWQSPPRCIEKRKCSSSLPQIRNGEISKESLADQYYIGSTVKYICADGYHIIGSDENKCMDGKWLQPPTCVENSCGRPQEIEHGKEQGSLREYNHGARVAYICSKGYKLSGSEPAVCLLGKWERVPQCIYSSCGSPPTIKDGNVRDKTKSTYFSDEKVTYDCANGYTMGSVENSITCKDSTWTEPPECRRIGETCGAPPVVQNGDITETKRLSYQSGSSVKYKCASYYKLEGKETIICRDGEWEKEPVCRVPCTVTDINMQQNNIQLKWKEDRKLYSEHFDYIEFLCILGYEISVEKLLRIQCLDGVLNYPKCLKRGSCVLQETEMARNNIRYNKGTEIENGQTIEFECEEGLVSDEILRRKCSNKQIKYPKCSAGRSCSPPKISNAVVSPERADGYESGSSVDIKCKNTYVINGRISIKCENGQWDELPQCLKPCTISTIHLDESHIELKSPGDSRDPEIIEHDKEVNVKCKTNFKRPGTLVASCFDGKMKYPRCFSGGFCRIIQQELDDNFLELDERHENEVLYEERETVQFKCKTGYSTSNALTGTCAKTTTTEADKTSQPQYILNYPKCAESAV